jgi:hypothetical protein
MSVKCIETAHPSRFTIPTARREPEGADRPLRGGGGWNDASDEALTTRTETHGESCQASVTTVTRPGPSEVTFLAGPGLLAEYGGWTPVHPLDELMRTASSSGQPLVDTGQIVFDLLRRTEQDVNGT